MACPCCPRCPTGCNTSPTVTVSWEGITLPDSCGYSPCYAWADNDGTYVRVLRTQTGDGLSIPAGGLLIIDGACYLTGYLGTSKIINYPTGSDGECRSTLIVWRWKLPYSDCSVASGGPYTLTPEFYSGYNLLWTDGSEQAFSITSVAGGCFSMSTPSVTLEFPP